MSDQHRRDVVTWWCEVMGGPAAYTEGLGGYEHMVSNIVDCTSPASNACASSHCCLVQPMMPTCLTIPSSGQR